MLIGKIMLSVFIISYLKAVGLLLAVVALITGVAAMYRRNRHVRYSCFIAGSTSLTEERDAIRAAISEISNKRKKISLSAYTFEDFPTKVIVDGPQVKYYNNFLRNSTDIAIFIVDGEIGKETGKEFDVAYDAFKEKKKPVIFVYCKEGGNDHEQSDILKAKLLDVCHYWRNYSDLKNLKLLFKEDLTNELDSYIGEVDDFGVIGEKRKIRFRRSLTWVVAILLLAVPVALMGDKAGRVPVSEEVVLDGTKGVMIKDELALNGRMVIEGNSLVKYKVSPTPLKRIDWKNVVDVITGTTTIYPKSDMYLYFYSEGTDGKKQEKEFFFDFHAFIEKSIRTSDMRVLKDMFYSIQDKDGAKYYAGDRIEQALTPDTVNLFFKMVGEKNYHIDEVEFAEETDIFSSEYPRVKTIRCSK